MQVLRPDIGQFLQIRIAIQPTKEVINENRVLPNRVISFFDPEARPIKKGKLGRTVEFGYKLRIDETENGFVTPCLRRR